MHFGSVFTEGMAAAKAMSIAVEMAQLCIIFPTESVVFDSSFGFSDNSATFRCVAGRCQNCAVVMFAEYFWFLF